MLVSPIIVIFSYKEIMSSLNNKKDISKMPTYKGTFVSDSGHDQQGGNFKKHRDTREPEDRSGNNQVVNNQVSD